MQQKVQTETVDIQAEAAGFTTYSDASLETVNAAKGINHKWLRATVILWLSVAVIGAILFASLATIALSSDATTRDWARQTLTALMGFAAGAIWSSAQGGNSEK